jgi:hypothetical protein
MPAARQARVDFAWWNRWAQSRFARSPLADASPGRRSARRRTEAGGGVRSDGGRVAVRARGQPVIVPGSECGRFCAVERRFWARNGAKRLLSRPSPGERTSLSCLGGFPIRRSGMERPRRWEPRRTPERLSGMERSGAARWRVRPCAGPNCATEAGRSGAVRRVAGPTGSQSSLRCSPQAPANRVSGATASGSGNSLQDCPGRINQSH